MTGEQWLAIGLSYLLGVGLIYAVAVYFRRRKERSEQARKNDMACCYRPNPTFSTAAIRCAKMISGTKVRGFSDSAVAAARRIINASNVDDD